MAFTTDSFIPPLPPPKKPYKGETVNRLKPCPFCGNTVKITQEDCYGYHLPDEEHIVCCDFCGLQFGFAKCLNKHEIVSAWNKNS